MKKLWGLLAIYVVCSLLAFGVPAAKAAELSKIKVGILLPLTGTFAAVAETQKQGALLAIDVINQQGGLNMPGGKVVVEGIVDDDEAKLDVGVRRYRYMVSEDVKGVGGQTWAPLAYAINSIAIKEPMPYFPVCVMAKEGFQKGKLANLKKYFIYHDLWKGKKLTVQYQNLTQDGIPRFPVGIAIRDYE